MQDGAPGHAARETNEDLQERGIIIIFWLLFSPNLNPIERVWHIMKNYLQDNYPENMLYNRLRAAINEAWERVGRFELETLIISMKDCCQSIINANGLFPKY